ncbi:MAG: hypothetical protein MMC23_007976 [Stictis urceolatum]|nr:hypothetical protein [Stictis urceolata]
MCPPDITPQTPIAIIGAGLSGLTLALSIHRLGLPCTIYELRPSSSAASAGGAIMLSPNALRILDTLDLYHTLKALGWSFSSLHYVEDLGSASESLDKGDVMREVGRYDLGNEERYGYNALRVYRRHVLGALRSAVSARGIRVEYGRKFTGVVRETEGGVRIAFEGGDEVDAALLVGADGIHSSVRKIVVPEIQGPKYSGLTAVTGAVDRSALVFPEEMREFPMPATVQSKHGAFVFAPQTPDGSELLCGTQFRYPEQDREGWARLLADREEIKGMLGRGQEGASELVRSTVRGVKMESLNVWAFYVVPKLRTWSSEGGKVLVLGDAAHAIPPTAGQGATMGIEDGFSLAALMGLVSKEGKWKGAVEWWQGVRQTRVDQVLDLTARLNNARLPKEEREKLPQDKLWASDGGEDLGWLYNHRIEEEVLEWARKEESS